MLLHALRGWMNSVEQCHLWKSQLMLEIRMLVISRCKTFHANGDYRSD